MSPETFPQTFTRLRTKAGLSQWRIAIDAGLTPGFLSRLERGERVPSRHTIDQLAAAMGLTAADTDALLASAGYLPRDVANLFAGEPQLRQVIRLLLEEQTDLADRATLRELLGSCASLVAARPRVSQAAD